MIKNNIGLDLFGLLHLKNGERSAINVAVRDFDHQTELYVKNAITLFRSLKRKGINFTLLTNEKDTVEKVLDRLNESHTLPVKNIDFHLQVPSGIRFYSAHHKIDAIRYLSLQDKKSYVGLIDLDMIALEEVPQNLIHLINHGIPVVYDISDQELHSYGIEVILQDLEKLLDNCSEGRWSGGELILGTPDFFALLYAEIEQIYGKYIEVYKELHHIGDEAITSAALEILRQKHHIYIADAGTIGIVRRFWSIPPLYKQKPLIESEKIFLLHLPSDKRFLAKLSNKESISANEFFKEYRKYLLRWKFVKWLTKFGHKKGQK